MLNLTVKEEMLLQDEKSHEELCVQKYKDYAQKASDPELQNLFNQLAQKEQQHLDSINQLLSGTIPNINQGQNQNQNSNSQNNSAMPNLNLQALQGMSYNSQDKMLCQDSLSTEKYISSTYNTTIFEFKNKNIRQVLNHIQKEEQEHGEKIYNYMNQHNMYN